MKKIVVMVLALLFTFSNFMSAYAASKIGVVVLDTPGSAYQSETFVVTLKVSSKGVQPGKWRVEFPKSAVSLVQVDGKRGLTLADSGDYFILTIDPKKLKSSDVPVAVTISSSANGDDYPLLSLYDQNGTFVEQRQINVLVAELVWSVESPFSYPVATNFQIFLRATNNTSVPIAFDVDTEFFHQCTDKSLYPSAYPVLAVNGGGGTASVWLQFVGEVPAGQTFEWTFDLKSGFYSCNAPVFELRDNMRNDLSIWKQWLVVLAP